MTLSNMLTGDVRQERSEAASASRPKRVSLRSHGGYHHRGCARVRDEEKLCNHCGLAVRQNAVVMDAD